MLEVGDADGCFDGVEEGRLVVGDALGLGIVGRRVRGAKVRILSAYRDGEVLGCRSLPVS